MISRPVVTPPPSSTCSSRREQQPRLLPDQREPASRTPEEGQVNYTVTVITKYNRQNLSREDTGQTEQKSDWEQQFQLH